MLPEYLPAVSVVVHATNNLFFNTKMLYEVFVEHFSFSALQAVISFLDRRGVTLITTAAAGLSSSRERWAVNLPAPIDLQLF